MISKDAVDLINSQDAIAIVGSGISIESGVPSWMSLFYEIATNLEGKLLDTSSAKTLAQKEKLPEAFDKLAQLATRDEIHLLTNQIIQHFSIPNRHHNRISDWPFKFYITTNHDHLIEASSTLLESVGNRGNELHKMSAGVKDVVWHVHGGSELNPDKSQLIITKSDYNDFYPSSNTIDTLKGHCKNHRCIFIGFGFADFDFNQVLKAVGRFSHSSRPSYAFLGYDDLGESFRSHQRKLH